jgi:glutaredoxin
MRAPHLLLLLIALGIVSKYDDIKRFWYGFFRDGNVAAGLQVYTSNNCPPCEEAAALFDQAGIPYTLLNIEQDAEALADFEHHGSRLPLIVDGKRSYAYYDPEFLAAWYVERPRMRSMLDRIGVYRPGGKREIVLYGTDWCGYCAAARQYFAEHDIPYRDLDIERDDEAAEQHRLLGHSGVPVIVYQDMVWSGFSAKTMDARREWVESDVVK